MIAILLYIVAGCLIFASAGIQFGQNNIKHKLYLLFGITIVLVTFSLQLLQII